MSGRPPTRTVLIVEDDVDVRETVAMLLRRRLGLRVVEAGDGPSALALARAEPPALVILDYVLPGGMNGIELAERLRAEPSTAGVPLLSLTASAVAQGPPFDAWVEKPFRADRLVESVRRLLAEAAGGGQAPEPPPMCGAMGDRPVVRRAPIRDWLAAVSRWTARTCLAVAWSGQLADERWPQLAWACGA